MPKRQRTREIDASAVQGEGAWIKIRSMSLKEAREIQRIAASLQAQAQSSDPLKAAAATEEISRKGIESFAEYVEDWNWVDDDGEPLPKPYQNPAALELLTIEEFSFISKLFATDDSAQKN